MKNVLPANLPLPELLFGLLQIRQPQSLVPCLSSLDPSYELFPRVTSHAVRDVLFFRLRCLPFIVETMKVARL